METIKLQDIELSTEMMTAEQINSGLSVEKIVSKNIVIGDGKTTFNDGDYEKLENAIGDDGNAHSQFMSLSSYLIGAKTSEISGTNSLAIGGFAIGDNSVAIGMLNRTGKYPDKSFALGDSSIALGNLAKSVGRGAVSLGSGLAQGSYSVATCGGTATGECAVSFGSDASGLRSLAAGVATKASGVGSVSFGHVCVAEGNYSFAAGHGSKATGQESFTIGRNSSANGNGSVAFGMGTKSNGVRSVAIGYSSEANGEESFAQGYDSIADGRESQAFGYYTYAKGDMSHSNGYFASTCLSTHIISQGSLNVNKGDIVQWTNEGWKFVADQTHEKEEPYYSDIKDGMTPAYEACKMANNDHSFLTGNRPTVGKYYQIKPDGGRDNGIIYWAFFDINTTKCDLAWCWNGDMSRVNSTSGRMYNSHGNGTFNINPVGGSKGLYIGEKTLDDIISDKVSELLSKKI